MNLDLVSVSDRQAWQAQWAEAGYVVIPQFFPEFLDSDQPQLSEICDRIYDQAIAARPSYADSTNIATLTDPGYFGDRLDELIVLLEFIAHPRILALLEAIASQPPVFHNTQYFHHPARRSWDGPWHRDSQFGANPAVEQQRMAALTGVHVRVAFAPDAQLEYVPGSHLRWDTEAEWAIRGGDNPTQADMPGRVQIPLNPGDVCVFHAWGIHRGTYRADIPRRTLDVIYGWGEPCDWATPDPTCFTDPALFLRLSHPAKAFYQRFIDTYSPLWDKRALGR